MSNLETPRREGECRRLADGRLVILREAFPDGAWGADVVAEATAVVAEDWVEVDAAALATASLVR